MLLHALACSIQLLQFRSVTGEHDVVRLVPRLFIGKIRVFERRFTASAMASGYLRLSDKVLSDPSHSS